MNKIWEEIKGLTWEAYQEKREELKHFIGDAILYLSLVLLLTIVLFIVKGLPLKEEYKELFEKFHWGVTVGYLVIVCCVSFGRFLKKVIGI
ncbi:MAG: hypothetical protein HZA70_07480 [Planctomycetes bacterium]|nr:hypothetical protein [Planctomycetota bacterium]